MRPTRGWGWPGVLTAEVGAELGSLTTASWRVRQPVTLLRALSSCFPGNETALETNSLWNFPCICVVSLTALHFLWAGTICSVSAEVS